MTGAPPPAPWTCRVRAVNRFAVGRRGVVLLAVVHYVDSPVGPYREALLADVRGLRVTVPWIVVDSVASRDAGRALWGLPKELGALTFDHPGDPALVEAGGVRMQVGSRPVKVRLPGFIPGWLSQPGRPRARLRFRGWMRPALVEVSGALPDGLSPGTGPGALLDGVLRLGPAA